MWRVKWGHEVHTETFAARLAWAAGYFVEVNYFVPSGRIEDAETLQRAGEFIAQTAAFSMRASSSTKHDVIKHFDEHSWAWNDNPFVGSHELNGLKIVMMWLSNWDDKDVRDVARGSNTAIFEYRPPRWAPRPAISSSTGAALSGRGGASSAAGDGTARLCSAERLVRTGGARRRRAIWVQWPANCRCRGRDSGERRAVALQYLGGLTDDQLAAGLRASGGTESEIVGFTEGSAHASIGCGNLVGGSSWGWRF